MEEKEVISMEELKIRHAELTDLEEIEAIYSYARAFMAENGNTTQWKDGYPQRAMLEADIEKENLYVVLNDAEICGVFLFVIGEDPTYTYIEGKWPSSDTYGTIHRIASDGTHKGVMQLCVDFCRTICPHIRIDTHEKNQTMRNALTRLGFSYCGTIYIEDGTPRMAFCLLP
jgi:hypothetical protein